MPALLPDGLRLVLLAVAGVPEHAHCEMCGIPVSVGDRRCGSEACETKFQEALRAKKRGMWMFIGVIFFAMMMTFFRASFL